MNLLTAEGITIAYSERKLIEDSCFYMDECEKVGIIGVNGTGKSTLLRIIAGEEVSDDGVITYANNKVIAYLRQQEHFEAGQSVLEYIMSGIEDEDVWGLEAKAKSMLGILGVTDYNKNVEELSGGQRKKIALIRTLLLPADLLILDEPTNHLDNYMTEWLEGYLKEYRGAVLMVTHDRYFLDNVVTRIVEIDKGKIYSYKTNYSGFLELKLQREEMELSTDAKKANLLRNERKWVMRGAKARSTKQKARLERYEELKNRKRPELTQSIEMSSVSTRLGRTTVELNNISFGYDDKLLIKDFSYIFLKGDRVGFVGANGCGKTTLMKIILGELLPSFGEVVVGQTVKIGYYAQEISNNPSDGLKYMNPDIKVIDYIRNTAEYVKTVDGEVSASQMLEKFLFSPSKQYSLIKNLSGGEKRRLNLLRVLMEAPNVLVMDEPTNDLDISTLGILEDYLDGFDGIVIIVSHDRFFLDRTTTRTFAFEEGGVIRQYECSFSDYLLIKNVEAEAVNVQAETEKTTNNTNSKPREHKLKFTYKEQQEYNVIEDEIEALENRIVQIDKDMNTYARDFVKLNELGREQEEVTAALEAKMERWDYLMNLAEQIENQ